jgi:hypothetical protein
MATSSYESDVFVNCPFDPAFKPIFDAIVFAISDCGFRPRCSLEIENAGQVRIDRILTLIRECRFGIHDISRTEADAETGLPRFNMPFELGIFLGTQRFGSGAQRRKVCLIFDKESFRCQSFISDISGQDIRSHHGKPGKAIEVVRNWLRTAHPEVSIPGGDAIAARYKLFASQLPAMCKQLKLVQKTLTFVDFMWLVSSWLRANSAVS